MKKMSFMIALFLLSGLGYAQQAGTPSATKASTRTAYANIIGEGSGTGYYSFPLNNFAGKIRVCNSFTYNLVATTAHAGEYFDGKLHTFFTGSSNGQVGGTIMTIFTSTNCEQALDERGYYDGALVTAGEVYGAYIRDAAYDYSMDTMYTLWGMRSLYVGGKGTVRDGSTITLAATITGVEGYLLTLAIDLDGNMYGISNGSDAKLYKIDKTTGVATLIGSTGMAANGTQSMGFDHYDNVLYWCQSDGGTNSAFATVNTSTGAATVLQTGTGVISCFHVPYEKSPTSLDAGTVEALNIEVYPNPVNDKLFIQAAKNVKHVEIYTVQGKLIKRIEKNVSEIDVNELKAGVYMLQISTDKGVATQRFVKQ